MRRLVVALLIVLAMPLGAEAALNFSAPLVTDNSTISCPTCCTEASPAQYNIPVWGTTQEMGTIAPSAQTTYPLFSAGSSANPSFRAIAIGDIPFTKGTANQTKVVTTTDAAVTNGNCAEWDTDGNLVDSGGTCGSSGLGVAHHDVSPLTQVTVTDATDVFCGFDGSCSTTANGTDVQTRFTGTGTFEGINAAPLGPTTTAITIDLDCGTCGGALATGSATATLGTSSWAAMGSSSGTTSFTDGQCCVFKYSTTGADADQVVIRSSVKQTAGS